ALAIPFLAHGLAHPGSARAASAQYDEFWRNDSAAAFAAWTTNGTTTSGGNIQLASSRKAPLTCASGDIDGGATSYDAHVGLCAGTDPYAPGTYSTRSGGMNYYNGGSFFFATLLSPVHATAAAIDHIIASWDAATPAGTWLELHVRALSASGWTHWY